MGAIPASHQQQTGGAGHRPETTWASVSQAEDPKVLGATEPSHHIQELSGLPPQLARNKKAFKARHQKLASFLCLEQHQQRVKKNACPWMAGDAELGSP